MSNYIKNLINKQIPVMALWQGGHVRWGIDSPWLKIYADKPDLHWIVISGYDEHNIYYYNTKAGKAEYENGGSGLNDMRWMSWGQFLILWAWHYGGYRHGAIHQSLVNADIVRPRTILWLNR